MLPAALLACALNVSLVTLEAVVRVESGGDPLALHVNGVPVQPARGQDTKEVVRTAEGFMRRGYSVDLGLMQLNSRNLPALGLTVLQALDPCTNLRAGAAILAADYAAAAQTRGEGQAALLAALSAYNTGDFARGFRNGYVARYVPVLAGHAAPAPSPVASDSTVYVQEAPHVRVQ